MPSPPDGPLFGGKQQGLSLADFYVNGGATIRRPPLPVRPPLDGPVRAVKMAGLTMVRDQIRFWGIGLGTPGLHYGADAPAVCHARLFGHQYSYHVDVVEKLQGSRFAEPHTPPGDHCTCGFYCDTRPGAGVMTGHDWWTIEVELLGDGIRHKSGWRFARQRVIAVRASAHCVMCSWRGRTDPPDVAYLAVPGQHFISSLAAWVRLADRTAATNVPIIRTGHSQCIEDHNRDHGVPDLQVMSFAELRHRLAPVELQTVPGGLMAA